MGISLKDKRGRRRRSYADYRPPENNPGPRNDPFRILIYLILIAGGVWVYFNQGEVLALIAAQRDQVGEAVSAAAGNSSGDEDLPTPEPGGPSLEEITADAVSAYEQGQLEQAVALYTQASELDPANVQYYLDKARLLIYLSAVQYGDTREASLEAAYEAAQSAKLEDPFSPVGFAIEGKVLDWQGRPEQGQSSIARALELDDEYALAHSYMGEVQVDLDRWDQALESINRALELDPNSFDVRRDYAYINEVLGDYAAAVTQYEAALQIQPRMAPVRVALARAYRVNGQYDESLDQLFEAQLVMPQNPVIAYEIGRTYETYIGDPNEALANYEQATDIDPQYPAPWVRIGTLRYFSGLYADAITAFERALALEAESTDLYYQLGLSYVYDGDCERGLRNLDEAYSRSQSDQRIIDAVSTGYEVCAEPTPEGLDITPTPEE